MTVRACSDTSVELALGDVWLLDVRVTDADGRTVADEPVVTVTLPAGSTAAPEVTSLAVGRYRAAYVVGTAGRYVARAVTTTNGVADFAAFVTATVAGTGMPDVDDLDAYLASLGGHSWSDDELQDALDTEAANQRKAIAVPAAFGADLRQALLRRATRNLALRKLAVATMVGDADDGSSAISIPGLDREIRRYEGPYRRLIGR